jgi:hypothetical protein
MRAFDFVLLFFSFVYALALTHLLMAAARMIRYRRSVVFSVPHAMWMLVALALVISNWISFWDFHTFTKISAAEISVGFAFSILVYLACALLSPDFDPGGTIDLRAFHEQQGTTYMGAMFVTLVASVVLNAVAASSVGLQSWGNENTLVIAMLPPMIAALVARKTLWVQVVAPLILAVELIAYIFLFYPVLK